MRPGGGRSKGNAFEREIARQIVHAFKKFGITKADCYRTPLSGGHRAARETDPGDLVISDKLVKLFPWVVECKRDRRWELSHLFVPTKKRKRSWVEEKFLEQAASQAKKYSNRKPVLVVRKDNETALAVIPVGGENLSAFLDTWWSYSPSLLLVDTSVKWNKDETWAVLPWAAFLEVAC